MSLSLSWASSPDVVRPTCGEHLTAPQMTVAERIALGTSASCCSCTATARTANPRREATARQRPARRQSTDDRPDGRGRLLRGPARPAAPRGRADVSGGHRQPGQHGRGTGGRDGMARGRPPVTNTRSRDACGRDRLEPGGEADASGRSRVGLAPRRNPQRLHVAHDRDAGACRPPLPQLDALRRQQQRILHRRR